MDRLKTWFDYYIWTNNKANMKIRLTLLFSLFTVAIFAPNNHDPRLLVKYESSFLDRMASKHQVSYQKLTYYLDHGYQIIDQNDSKFKDLKDYVTIDDMDHINLYQIELEQNIQADYKARKVYKIKGRDQFLVLLPKEEIYQAFNDYRTSN